MISHAYKVSGLKNQLTKESDPNKPRWVISTGNGTRTKCVLTENSETEVMVHKGIREQQKRNQNSGAHSLVHVLSVMGNGSYTNITVSEGFSDLASALRKSTGRRRLSDNSKIRRNFLRIAEANSLLNNLGFVHRDIKLD
eukprot:834746_1